MRRALQIVLALASFGSVFSGVLTYRELFGATALSCPAPGAPGTLLGCPACVYGFGMFVAIAVVAAVGLVRGRAPGDGTRTMLPQARSARA
jgi:hypothetical protein